MKCNEQNKLTKSRNRLIVTENRLTAVRGEEIGGLSEEGEGIKQKTIKKTERQTTVW